MTFDKKKRVISAVIAAVVCAGIIYVFVAQEEYGTTDKTRSIVKTEDLSNHPIYRNYHFGSEKNVIDFGEQPLWIPTSTISEVMKRDTILRNELKKLGFSIRFHSFLKGNDVNYFILNGNLEAGIGGDMPAIRVVAEGDVTVTSIIQEGPVSIISKDIREVRSLRGKKIAYALGSNAHFYLLNTLNKNGIMIDDVELVKLDIVYMADALQKGTIDAFSAWEPTASMALTKYPEFIVTHSGKSYGFVYLKNEFYTSNQEAAGHILASEIRALKWIRAKESNLTLAGEWVIASAVELSSKVSKELPITLEMISSLAKKDIPGILMKEYPRIPADLLATHGMLKKEFDLLQNLGLVSGTVKWEDVEKYFDLDIMETVISNSEKYKLFDEVNYSSAEKQQ